MMTTRQKSKHVSVYMSKDMHRRMKAVAEKVPHYTLSTQIKLALDARMSVIEELVGMTRKGARR